MYFQFFQIPALDPGEATRELNQFLKQHRILRVEREFVSDGRNSFWTMCVSFAEQEKPASGQPAKRGIDYRDVLNEQDFAIFARLRTLRKELAEKEGVPAYALFTNEQLASMVQSRVDSKAALKKISGVGEAKVKKYGDAFVAALSESFPSKTEQPTTANETQQDNA